MEAIIVKIAMDSLSTSDSFYFDIPLIYGNKENIMRGLTENLHSHVVSTIRNMKYFRYPEPTLRISLNLRMLSSISDDLGVNVYCKGLSSAGILLINIKNYQNVSLNSIRSSEPYRITMISSHKDKIIISEDTRN